MAANRYESARGGLTPVSFCCQRCSQPLKVDPSFYSIDPHVYKDLTAPMRTASGSVGGAQNLASSSPTSAANSESHEAAGGGVTRIRGVSRYESADSGHDFTVIGQDEAVGGDSLSQKHKIHIVGELFDILSSQSQMDHPLCEECTDNLLDQLDQLLKTTEDECKDYKEFLQKLNGSGDEVNEESLVEELQQLKLEEEALKAQLEEVESNRQKISDKITEEKSKTNTLIEDEKRYYKEYNEYKRQLLEYEDAQKSVDNQLKYARTQLDNLTKTNVFNNTFHIWHNGHFGTINTFRLGRLPNVPVEWTEINAAWGQAVLLLHSLANKMNLTFERYRLVPYGSHSYIESLDDKSKDLPLWAAGGFKFFWDHKFDMAMVAFLDCLQQFKEKVDKVDSNFCLPYKMSNGSIEDPTSGTQYSVRIQFNSEEQWTKALKFMLTNLKWDLAWVSVQFANK